MISLIKKIFFLLAAGSTIFAQSYLNNLKFEKYSTTMGLSSNAQRCITQDKEGFIWIGTDDGLNRFDGRTFKVYRTNQNDPNSLRSNIINCLFTDSKSTLWVGTTAGGLSRYDKYKDNFTNYVSSLDSNSLLNNDITTIAEDNFNRIWIGTSIGLHLYDPKINGFRNFTTVTGQPLNSGTIAYNHVKKIIVDNDLLWIGYTTGILTALNTKTLTFTHYKLFDVSSTTVADFSVNNLILDGNKIWISTWSKGIWIFDKSTGKSYPYEKEKSQYVNFIFKDNRNRIWYSPESKGLIMFDGKNEVNYQFDDYDRYSLSSNILADIFQDKQGNLWLANKQGDLNYLKLNNPFHSWYKKPSSFYGLSNNLLTVIIEDSKKRIWIGYQDGGIDIIDPQNKQSRIHIKGDNSSGLGPGPVTSILKGRDGTVWIGKYLDGLKKYDEKTGRFTSFKHIDGDLESIAGNDIRHITEDRNGNLWLAIHGGGIDKFDPKTGKFFHHRRNDNNPSTTIISDWTFTAVCDKNNNIWVGTIAGVSVLSEKSAIVKHYLANAPDGQDLSNNLSRVIYIDSKDYVWIGTIDGLNKLDPRTNSIKKYFTGDGLPNTVILGILEDNNNDLWISTAKGLSKFLRQKEKFKNFSVLDGLVTDEFNMFSSFKSPTGELYFGGRDGLNYFHPDSIKTNKYIPPVYITDFKLFNQSAPVKRENVQQDFYLQEEISFCKEVTLEYHQNVITIEFIALNYLNLEKNQYRYKLEGFDKNWTLPGYKREVTYTNLPPGEYVFKVIASNNDGVWNTQGASLSIIVKPPLWRTKWAYAFYIILLIVLLYYFRKIILHEAKVKRTIEMEELEIQKLQEMDNLKMQFFSNVSHEFRTPLTLIVGPIEKLIRTTKDELQQIQLKLIYRNANRLLRMINQLMDFRKIEEARLELNATQGDIINFIKDIVSSFEQEAKHRNIDFKYIPSHESFQLYFDSDKLEKIIFNLLSNAFKYTPDSGEISISVVVDNEPGSSNNFIIKVKDSGIGIAKDLLPKIFDRFYQVKNQRTNQGTGIGLSFTYELVKLHQGQINVESEPDHGSEFIVSLPVWLNEEQLPKHISVNKTTEPAQDFSISTITQRNIEIKNAVESNDLPRILIIEDNADMRLYIKNEFSDSYKISEAHNGTVGLEKAFEEMPDAIICDVMMPGIDGYQVCKTLKQDERTSHIPLVMLTAKSSEQHTIEGFESGADDYVAKPFNSALLRTRIKNLIESRITLRKKFIKDPFATIKDISPSKTDEKLLNKAYDIVEKNIENADFEVSDFANEMCMSRTQLYRKIQAISGQSVKEFIRIIRLKKAAELLLTTDQNVSEISVAVGFNSLSYFTSSFTEYFGMSPTKYLEKHTRKN
ncbi:MAG: response regulator [Ignavibacteriales bacterium]|nr:MAG: response regulator [Ignavibacteriales bacterium]